MNWRKFFLVSTRIFLGLIFFTAGMGKLYSEHLFPGLIGPVWLEDRLAEFDLGLYARFIGYSQVVIGLLLITQRFATLGAVMLVPMIANILMVTVSMNWQGTPYVLAFLLMLNVLILWLDFQRLKFLVSDLPTEKLRPLQPLRQSWLVDGIILFGMLLILLSIPISYVQITLAYGMVIFGLLLAIVGPIWGKRRAKKVS